MSDDIERSRRFAPSEPPADDIHPEALAWYAEYQRAALLLETLAADHFPDQAAFEAWIERQAQLILGRGR